MVTSTGDSQDQRNGDGICAAADEFIGKSPPVAASGARFTTDANTKTLVWQSNDPLFGPLNLTNISWSWVGGGNVFVFRGSQAGTTYQGSANLVPGAAVVDLVRAAKRIRYVLKPTCTLRAAIEEANAGGAKNIDFALTEIDPNYDSGRRLWTIKPATPLPVVTIDGVVIDATTQGSGSVSSQAFCASNKPNADTPTVVLNGSSVATGSGLEFNNVAGCAVAGLAIQAWSVAGIKLENSSGCFISRNFIGTDELGSTAHANHDGISLVNANANQIGGLVNKLDSLWAGPTGGNLISGNTNNGIRIEGSASTGNLVQSNCVGTDISGTQALPNEGFSTTPGAGVVLVDGARNNLIGVDAAGAPNAAEGNLISGNKREGLGLDGVGTKLNEVRGNIIGPDWSGSGKLTQNLNPEQQTGIRISGLAEENLIGTAGAVVAAGGCPGIGSPPAWICPPETGYGNIISANLHDGIVIEGQGPNNWVTGNAIGLKADHSGSLGNGDCGVLLYNGATGNVVGSQGPPLSPWEGNYISGNTVGVCFGGLASSIANTVQRNYIGLGDAAGGVHSPVAMGNDQAGVKIGLGAQFNMVNSNTISGNHGDGVLFNSLLSFNNIVSGNIIGGIAGGVVGDVAYMNLGDGVRIEASDSHSISNNWIFGNASHGIEILTGTGLGNLISGNNIRYNGMAVPITGAIDNGDGTMTLASPVFIFPPGGLAGRTLTMVTGSQANEGRLILLHNSTMAMPGFVTVAAFSGLPAPGDSFTLGGDGIRIWGGVNNRITQNSIFANGSWARAPSLGLGINLIGGTEDGFGVTENDLGDGDTGPNYLQNYPVITGVFPGMTVVGTLNSLPNTAFTIEVFQSNPGDASSFGEGQGYLGSALVTTDGTGNATFSISTSPIVGCVTATATDPNGNTSEFSSGFPFGVPSCP